MLQIYAFAPNVGGLLSLLLNFALPLGVGYVTTKVTGAHIKAVLLLGLAGLQVLIESAIAAANGSVHWNFVPVLMNVLISFAIAVMAHFGLWKPLGVSANIQENYGIKGDPGKYPPSE